MLPDSLTAIHVDSLTLFRLADASIESVETAAGILLSGGEPYCISCSATTDITSWQAWAKAEVVSISSLQSLRRRAL